MHVAIVESQAGTAAAAAPAMREPASPIRRAMRRWPASRRTRRAVGAVWLAVMLVASTSPRATAAPGTVSGVVIAKARNVTTRFRAYGRVVPLALARLRAAEPGVIAGLDAVPGQAVAAGAVLGRLAGPEIAARLAMRRGAVASAAAQQHAAERSLAAEREQRAARLATRQAVFQAQAALAAAKAGLATATAALRAAQSGALLRAPESGAVLALATADGERVARGQTVLTIVPAHRLWLKAIYYGATSGRIHLGMSGYFAPADGSAPIAVEVVSVLPIARPAGGRPVGLKPRAPAHLIAGEAGTVTLDGAPLNGVAVPTRALILDRGRWWVLVHAARGDERRAVTLGPSFGDWTLITHGLPVGAAVVVTDAYLKFHRDVAQRYQPPD